MSKKNRAVDAKGVGGDLVRKMSALADFRKKRKKGKGGFDE